MFSLPHDLMAFLIQLTYSGIQASRLSAGALRPAFSKKGETHPSQKKSFSSLHKRDCNGHTYRDAQRAGRGALLARAGGGILRRRDAVLSRCTDSGGNTATGSSGEPKGLRHRQVARMSATVLVFSSPTPFSAPSSSLNFSSSVH
jgi:hypothetical protein